MQVKMDPELAKVIERLKDLDVMPCEIPKEQTDIQRFFAGKSILLTGATGFMGKIFVEKLLRACPDIKTLYVVVRQKKGLTPEEIIKKYFQNFVFNWVRKSFPNFESKVVMIKGDLQEDQLDISDADRQLLINEVDIIVHNGAITKFNARVHVSLKINVLATKHLLDLALECKRIKAFIYVSTAYSHCYNQDIEERFYDAPADLKTIHDIIESDTKAENGISEEALEMILGRWVNIYTFGKSMAEDLIRQYGKKANFACGVYRPSIVTASYREPYPGWIGSINGPAFGFLGAGLGVVHAFYYTGSPMDIVPVDMSINALIAVIYDLPDRWQREKEAVMYNYGSSTVAPIDFYDMKELSLKIFLEIGSKYQVYMPFYIMTKIKLLFYVYHFFLHFIPALLADVALLVTGRKPMCLSIFWFATKNLDKIFYFINGNWRIHVTEMYKVLDRLSPDDRKLFHFDMHNMDWFQWASYYALACRFLKFKENWDTIPETQAWIKKLLIIHYSICTILLLFLVYFAYRIFNYVLNFVF